MRSEAQGGVLETVLNQRVRLCLEGQPLLSACPFATGHTDLPLPDFSLFTIN